MQSEYHIEVRSDGVHPLWRWTGKRFSDGGPWPWYHFCSAKSEYVIFRTLPQAERYMVGLTYEIVR